MGENYITCREADGSIDISAETISYLVREAVSQREGAAVLSDASGAEVVELIGIKTLSKGVKVQFGDSKVIVDAIITVKYGFNIVNVAQTVQEEILGVILSATGLEQAEVDVHVSGVAFDK